jgi:hypothetical protein
MNAATLQAELVALEEGFWTDGADYYRRHADDRCLFAFAELSGVFSNDQVAQMVAGARWAGVEIRPKGMIEAGAETAILTYEASAQREGEPYRALVSSAYVRRQDGWKLVFHQQTKLD